MSNLKICLIPDRLRLDGAAALEGGYFHALARRLRDAGHEVALLDPLHRMRPAEESAELLRCHRDEGLTLLRPAPPKAKAAGSPHGRLAALPYYSYEALKRGGFDLIHASDRGGAAYYYLQAKRLGLLPAPARVWVHVGQPYLCGLERGEERMERYSDPLRCWLERRSVELADEVVARSRSIRDWMLRAGYARDAEAFRLDPGLIEAAARPRGRKGDPPVIERLLFLGSLDQVGGLPDFCYLLRELLLRGVAPRSVLLLGAEVPGFDARAFLQRQAAGWNFPWRLRSGFDGGELAAEVARPGSLSVFPGRYTAVPAALQLCLARGLPFVATATGDLPARLQPADAGLLAEPHHRALADRIEPLLQQPERAPATPLDPEANAATWLQWHAEAAAPPRPKKKPAAKKARVARDPAELLSAEEPPPLPEPEAPGEEAAPPLVSVCVAHFNRPGTLRHTLESLEAQSFRDFEVVVVDDGSDEAARRGLEALARNFPRVRLVFQPNLYLGAARNTGARNARGRYLLFMDDDNCAAPLELEVLVGIAERRPVDILVCFSDNFLGEGRPTPKSLEGIRRLPFGQDLVYGLLRNGYGDSNCFMRREVWEALGGFTEHYRVGLDDHELFTRATLAGFTIDVVPEALYFYRLADEKMKRFHASRRADVQRILQPYLDSGALPPDLVPLLFALRGFYERLEEAGMMRLGSPEAKPAEKPIEKPAEKPGEGRGDRPAGNGGGAGGK